MMKYELGRPSRRRASADVAAWWKGAAIYQIYPRSFADSNGDGVGDLPGITERLDYVASLGVDGIWLSPFFTSPMRDFGYDVADYCDVDPIFGTLADFDALIARAHALGLKVVIDQVYSHTSREHPWFVSSLNDANGPHADWYVWENAKRDGMPPNNWQSVFGSGAWAWEPKRRQYYFHNFLWDQPQLNVRNPAVQDALLDVARFWLDRGVDGFRLDAVNFMMHDPSLRNNPANPGPARRWPRTFLYQIDRYNQAYKEIPLFLERLRALLDSYGDRYTVAEIGGGDAPRQMKLATQGEKRLHTAYGFDFLSGALPNPERVVQVLEAWPHRKGVGWPSWAFENHDVPRAMSRWAVGEAEADARIARMRMLLLMCLRGNIFLYNGEELGLTQVDVPFDRLRDTEAIENWPYTMGRDGARTPMPWKGTALHCGFSSVEPWLPIGEDHPALAVDVQEADPASLLNQTRAMLALRNAHPALREGRIKVLHVGPRLLIFRRIIEGSDLLCAFNLGGEDEAWPEDLQPSGVVVFASGGADHLRLPAYSGVISDLTAAQG